MVHSTASGGTSLAPTPTFPHHLLNETSREDVEMAEQLRQLNQSHESSAVSITSNAQYQDAATPTSTEAPEIYHSLEDSLPLRKSEQPAPAPNAEMPASLQPPSTTGGNALMSGQTCQYVDVISPSRSKMSAFG
jgi:GATA-binding protein